VNTAPTFGGQGLDDLQRPGLPLCRTHGADCGKLPSSRIRRSVVFTGGQLGNKALLGGV
jgi:hypothetical protein